MWHIEDITIHNSKRCDLYTCSLIDVKAQIMAIVEFQPNGVKEILSKPQEAYRQLF
jgi:hypothetical protein